METDAQIASHLQAEEQSSSQRVKTTDPNPHYRDPGQHIDNHYPQS